MIFNGEWEKHPWFNVLPLTFLPLSSLCCPFKHVCVFLWIGKSFAHINLLVCFCVCACVWVWQMMNGDSFAFSMLRRKSEQKTMLHWQIHRIPLWTRHKHLKGPFGDDAHFSVLYKQTTASQNTSYEAVFALFQYSIKKILRRFEASVLCMFWNIISSKKFMTNDGLKKYKTTTMAL